ncbi:MAG: Kelch repeat-containing protein, partial [Byssovorax sp.]
CGLAMVIAGTSACSPEGSLIGVPSQIDPAAGSRLRAHFPEQAARVLDVRGFVTDSVGFVLARAERAPWAPAGSRLRAELPQTGDQAIRLHVGELDVQVRELGATGEGALVGEAVAYRRAGGTSFWTAAPGGVEEWLHLAADRTRAFDAVAAWEVEGASLRESGDGVDVLDAAGVARIHVTAPAAYAAGGRAVGANLRVRASRIELTVEASGEEVLIDPVWVAAGMMSAARQQHTATLLGSGNVLLTGGHDGSSYLASSELYLPAMSAWSAAAPMLAGRGVHTATSLAGGKVLVAGGVGAGGLPLTSAELYDPVSNTWAAVAPMSVGRSGHSATLLLSGKVLVAGGGDAATLTSVELYDPSANAWLPAGPMNTGRGAHVATLLGSGKVLVTGGTGASSVQASAELYDPATSSWTPVPPMSAPRSGHSATSLEDGTVLVAAGYDGTSFLSSAEVYNPANNGWSPAGLLSVGRTGHVATLLVDGGVLVEGGANNSSPLSNVDVYNPTTSSWTAFGPMIEPRALHTATRLSSGKV